MKWIAKYHPELKAYVVDEEESGEMICTIDVEGKNKEEAESIARLIAAAPNLLLMVKNFLKWEPGTVNYITVRKDAEQLLKDITA